MVLNDLTSSSLFEKPPLTAPPPRCGEASTDVSTVEASGGGDDPWLLETFFWLGSFSLVEPNIMRMAGRKRMPWNSPKNTVIEKIWGWGDSQIKESKFDTEPKSGLFNQSTESTTNS